MYYVTGTSGLRFTAQLYGVALSNLSLRAADENWLEERQRYRDVIGVGIYERIKEQATSDGKAIYDAARDASAKIIGAIKEAAADTEGFYKHLIQREEREGVGQGLMVHKWAETIETDVLNGKNAADAARALKDLSGLARTLDGIMDAANSERLQIERARLEMDKETKGTLNREDPNGGPAYGIVEIPAIDESLLDEAEDDPANCKVIGEVKGD